MGPEWRTVRIGDLGGVVTGRTPPGNDPSYYGDSVPFLTPTDMNDLRRVERTERFLSNLGATELARCLVPQGVGVSCIGWQMGKAILIDRPTVTNQQINSIIVDGGVADRTFVYYSLQARRSELFNLGAGGSRTPILNKGDFERLPFLLPPLRDQHAIAHILGSLDDKIELNRRMNETLDAMARALFKSWFVDFDPVRAKVDGRKPSGMDAETVSLFPSEFVESGLGAIPKGWEVGTLGMLGELAIGGDWGEDEAFEGAVDACCLRGVDLEHLRQSGHASVPHRWFKPSSLERRAMDDRDVLVAGSGAGPTGRPLWMCADLLQALGPCVYSNFCKRIRCGTAAKAVYLDAWLHGMRESGEIWEHVNGTSVPNLDANSLLAGKEIPLPPVPVLDRYHDFVRPIWQELYAGQNRTLADLRDALLPKLLSGELRGDYALGITEAIA